MTMNGDEMCMTSIICIIKKIEKETYNKAINKKAINKKIEKETYNRQP